MEDKINFQLNYFNQLKSIITYVTEESEAHATLKTPVKSSIYSQSYSTKEPCFSDTFPHFISDVPYIVIPPKLKRHLQRNIPLPLLRKVDKDKDTAIEKCLIIASNLTSTIFTNNKWKSLSSTSLNKQIKRGNDNTFLYKYALDVLKYSTTTTKPVIEVKTNSAGIEQYQEGSYCKKYAFLSDYNNTGVVNYELKNKDCIEKRKKLQCENYSKVINNPIGINLINLYSHIKLPSQELILNEAKKLVRNKHRSKKGKLLTFLNHRKKEDYSNYKERSFVEDNYAKFKYLTNVRLIDPKIKTEKAGGRVYDSLNLMPSWIRNLITIDGEPIVEIDFKALHPNIAMTIYGGNMKYITHQEIAQESGLDLAEVKIEHLSFFNRVVPQMKQSVLYNFYIEREPALIQNIINDKYTSEHKHRITSKKLFAKEVEIMTNCIIKLNKKGILVGYVFDALFCKEKDAEIVKEVMNNEALNNGVFTTAK